MDRCEHCGTRISENDRFFHHFIDGDHSFYCNCMSMLCSWLLDGGVTACPEMFEYLTRTDGIDG